MILELFTDVLKGAILISGLITIMMMMIESLNIESKGKFFEGIKSSRVGGVLVGALLGAVPGCMGGFATVSLYTHGMISLGAVVAMMIATCGDESFLMLATIPGDAVKIFAGLFVLAFVAGLLTDVFVKTRPRTRCTEEYSIHNEDTHPHHEGRHAGWKRCVLFAAVFAFIVALVTGLLEEEDAVGESATGLNLLSEEWMNYLFATLSIFVLVVLVRASDHFVEEHLWHHVVAHHFPVTFAWTFGILAVIAVGLHFFDISGWISGNTALMVLLATLVGIIPQSGPHMVFVTLYAAGIVPLPVLLASCISQDGHACLPLIAESKRSFVIAKGINCLIALAAGYLAMIV